MSKVVFLRHGQSTWNQTNRFTGWTDVDLTDNGMREAHAAGEILKEEGYVFDQAFTSVLKRAVRTLWIVQDVMDLMWLPVEKDWRLNERHYGALQGLNKVETAEQYGTEQVHRWRRGFSVRPPLLADSDPRHPRFDVRYRGLKPAQLPAAESLEDTMVRVIACWNEVIAPQVQAGKKILLVAHGNTLRALIKQLDGMSEEAIMELNIPTGIPLVYEFDDGLRVAKHYYLGDAAKIQAAADQVAHQATAA